MSMPTTVVATTSGPTAPDLAATTGPGSGTDAQLIIGGGGPPARWLSRVRRTGRPQLRVVREAGMATAEYAVALIAACAFAAVLLTAVRAGAVLTLIGKLIAKALHVI